MSIPSTRRAPNLAAAIEFIHTATLLHDDVIDDSKFRRGRKSANTVWGNKSSILVGDYLLSKAFKLMIKDGSHECLEVLSDSSVKIAQGEILQLETEKNLNTALLLEPGNEKALYMLIDIKLKKSDFSKVKELSDDFKIICSTLCDKIDSINERLKDFQEKNES